MLTSRILLQSYYFLSKSMLYSLFFSRNAMTDNYELCIITYTFESILSRPLYKHYREIRNVCKKVHRSLLPGKIFA